MNRLYDILSFHNEIFNTKADVTGTIIFYSNQQDFQTVRESIAEESFHASQWTAYMAPG